MTGPAHPLLFRSFARQAFTSGIGSVLNRSKAPPTRGTADWALPERTKLLLLLENRLRRPLTKALTHGGIPRACAQVRSPASSLPAAMASPHRLIAIHLPQFHPIPENDAWWGRGFTEWTNVTKAKPLFPGHYQPQLPTDLGFYDLRLPEARQAQADLARQYGIYGFCYYHYWFNGKRLLERPVEDILKSGEPDFPFMLCWANENWTRRWDGSEQTILMKQDYHSADAREHCRALLPYFRDRRYIRVGDRPVFVVYRPKAMTDLDGYMDAFRSEATRAGVDLYICRIEHDSGLHLTPQAAKFDAAIEFQPQSQMLQDYIEHRLDRGSVRYRVKERVRRLLRRLHLDAGQELAVHKEYYYHNYNDYVNYVLSRYRYPNYKRFPGVTPMWDNTARRGEKAFLLHGENPEKYGEWLAYHLEHFVPPSSEENFVFINAWNEWAEGNHLEPCSKWGRAYLETTKRVADAASQPAPRESLASLAV